MWHEWNVNADDMMLMWFALYANLVTSCLACTTCVPVHGTCALIKYGTSKYLSGLVHTSQLKLREITTSHIWVLNTQNVNENMPNMIPIAYLNKNFMDCNENLAWGK